MRSSQIFDNSSCKGFLTKLAVKCRGRLLPGLSVITLSQKLSYKFAKDYKN